MKEIFHRKFNIMIKFQLASLQRNFPEIHIRFENLRRYAIAIQCK